MLPATLPPTSFSLSVVEAFSSSPSFSLNLSSLSVTSPSSLITLSSVSCSWEVVDESCCSREAVCVCVCVCVYVTEP